MERGSGGTVADVGTVAERWRYVDMGPVDPAEAMSQNPVLALVTPVFGRRKVVFSIRKPHGHSEMIYL